MRVKYSTIYQVESILEVDENENVKHIEDFSGTKIGDYLQWGWHGNPYTMRIYNEKLERETHYINIKLVKRCKSVEEASAMLKSLSLAKSEREPDAE